MIQKGTSQQIKNQCLSYLNYFYKEKANGKKEANGQKIKLEIKK